MSYKAKRKFGVSSLQLTPESQHVSVPVHGRDLARDKIKDQLTKLFGLKDFNYKPTNGKHSSIYTNKENTVLYKIFSKSELIKHENLGNNPLENRKVQNEYFNRFCGMQEQLKTQLEDSPCLNLVPLITCNNVKIDENEFIITSEEFIKSEYTLEKMFTEDNVQNILEILLQIILTIEYLNIHETHPFRIILSSFSLYMIQ